MQLQIRGGQLLLGSDGKLTTNEDCCCDDTTCCTTNKITQINFLSIGSIGNCCDWLIGTYLPDSGISGGCEYNYYEEFPEPDNPCVDLDVDPPPDPPPDMCFERTSFGAIYRWFPRSISIQAFLDNNDLPGDSQWTVSVTITFWVYSFSSGGGPGCTLRTAGQEGGGFGEADEDCSTGVVDFNVVVNGSSDNTAAAIHPSCSTADTGITIQVIIEPL
jgi:hypothetical protein